jgi:signal transduction histidine kinase
MFRNCLVTALRNIVRHKLYSFINIAGLGVGLSICKTIVEAHKGIIQVANCDPCGACFHVRIPLACGAESHVSVAAPA